MIHKKEYVRELIRKSLEGTLTAGEAALLKAARRIYEKEEWRWLLLAVLDEIKEKESLAQQEIPQPVLTKILETARRRKQARATVNLAIRYGMIAAAMLIVYIGFAVYHELKQPYQPSGQCAEMPKGMEIPVSEFASMIRYGDSESIPVAVGMQGYIAQVGNIEITRDSSGVLVLRALRPASAADTVGHPTVRFVTSAFQQCEVLLPDGTRARLNANSMLIYPMFIPEPDISYAQIRGEARVRASETPEGKRLVVETVNSQLQMEHGGFAVVATAADTRVTLLDGDLLVTAKQQLQQQVLKRTGSRATVRWTHQLDGRITESVSYQRKSKVEEATGWTKASRRYHNVPMREYVADMSRWYGFKVKDIHCIPASMRVNAMICYRAPLGEALAVAQKAGLRVHLSNGMYSFCDSDDAFKPTTAEVNGQHRSDCDACSQQH